MLFPPTPNAEFPLARKPHGNCLSAGRSVLSYTPFFQCASLLSDAKGCVVPRKIPYSRQQLPLTLPGLVYVPSLSALLTPERNKNLSISNLSVLLSRSGSFWSLNPS
jgi:hypothetical protein